MFAVILIHLRIQGITDGFLLHRLLIESRQIEFAPQVLFYSFQVHIRKQAAGTYRDGFLPFQYDLLQFCRETAIRLSPLPLKYSTTDSGKTGHGLPSGYCLCSGHFSA